MKRAYPVIIYKKEEGEAYHTVYIPDFNGTTQGETLVECIEMARDVMGLYGMEIIEQKIEFPIPFSEKNKYAFDDESLEIEYETLVDIDFLEYKKRLENRAVKKTLTIPYWMNEAAEKAGINFSKTLQEAIEEKIAK